MFGRPKLGHVNGRHYTEHTDDVTALKRAGKSEEAERLLLDLVNAVEAENKVEKLGVAPWYYEQLAVLYRQRKDYAAEIAILERAAAQPHSKGGPLFADRIAKAKALSQKTK